MKITIKLIYLLIYLLFFFFFFLSCIGFLCFIFFFQAEDGIRDGRVTGVQTCALPIWQRRLLVVLGAGDIQLAPGLAQCQVRALLRVADERSEERRVGKECRSRWS